MCQITNVDLILLRCQLVKDRYYGVYSLINTETLDANTTIFNQHARRYTTTEKLFFLLDRVRILNIGTDSCQKHYISPLLDYKLRYMDI